VIFFNSNIKIPPEFNFYDIVTHISYKKN
jgi:hypothetical protein